MANRRRATSELLSVASPAAQRIRASIDVQPTAEAAVEISPTGQSYLPPSLPAPANSVSVR